MAIKMNDKTVRRLVMDELEFEPSLDAADIGVAVEDGVVTLMGYVPNYAQKQKAERAAWRVKGVRALAQELKVRIPGEMEASDEDIAKRALDMFAWNIVVPIKDIKVKVQNGWVTLDGEVEWNYQRESAEKTVSNLAGVVGVHNNLKLRALEDIVETRAVENRITEALKRQAEIDASKITVSVLDGGIVNLKGVVRTWDERKTAEYAAWSTPGVRQVRDDLVLQVLQ